MLDFLEERSQYGHRFLHVSSGTDTNVCDPPLTGQWFSRSSHWLLGAGQGLQRYNDVPGRLVLLGMELGAVVQQLSPARGEQVAQLAHEHRTFWRDQRPEERLHTQRTIWRDQRRGYTHTEASGET